MLAAAILEGLEPAIYFPLDKGDLASLGYNFSLHWHKEKGFEVLKIQICSTASQLEHLHFSRVMNWWFVVKSELQTCFTLYVEITLLGYVFLLLLYPFILHSLSPQWVMVFVVLESLITVQLMEEQWNTQGRTPGRAGGLGNQEGPHSFCGSQVMQI